MKLNYFKLLEITQHFYGYINTIIKTLHLVALPSAFLPFSVTSANLYTI